MTKRAILAALLLAVPAGAVTAAPLVDGSVKAGKKKSAVCAACHGAKGNSSSPKFPKLAGQNARYIFKQLKLYKSGKRSGPIMSAQAAALSIQDMKDLAVYYAAQEIKPGVVTNTDLAQLGAKIYYGGLPEFDVPACSGCHGPSGLGNPAAAYPRISGQHAKYIIQELKQFRDGERGNYPTANTMHAVTRGLSDHQIKALAEYITALMPAQAKHNNTTGALLQDPPETKAGKKSTSDGKSASGNKSGTGNESSSDKG